MTIGSIRDLSGAVKPSNLEWEGFEPNLSAHRSMEMPNNLKERLDYTGRSDGQPVYQGFAPKGLAEGDDGWLLYKLTYDGDGYMTDRDIAYGNWTNRASETYD